MLQQDEPDDFVLATGETHPVREFVEKAFAIVGTEIVWEGERDTVDEVGKCAKTGKVLVRVDERYFVSFFFLESVLLPVRRIDAFSNSPQRPAEVDLLHGTPAKAERVLVSLVSPYFP